MLTVTIDHDGLSAQIPYWTAVLTPEERSFGCRRTDPTIDTIGSSVVTETSTQYARAGAEHPSATMLLTVLAATVGAWQSDRCRSCVSGVLVDIEANSDTPLFPVRLPTSGDAAVLAAEVRRRVAVAPYDGNDFEAAKHTAAALARKSGAQIAFRYGSSSRLPDDELALQHSLTVTCDVNESDGVTTVDAKFRWNSRIFTRSDVDDFERFWEKTLATFV
ncbi:hypothetical protein QMK17_10550 [Rhodococcus sp. G-MC3]|uniref:hypothetical protein n=1 Tax=Rhodococcus sp. G-MC3 TaxID=3046209 RepID=UPI0024BB7EE5|nr:hypothetical protein [Rhodococcus sp. G-MC3]MDJ0393769.1 hypothetical protein [Rhodococcus sp. G-MC3]